MIRRRLQMLVLVLLATLFTTSVRAHGTNAPEPAYVHTPSVFGYAGKGFLIGSFGGVATGYLLTRPDGVRDDDWRTLLFATGIGALTGSGVGLGLGFFDLTDSEPGTGWIALRDMMYGSAFGAVAGTAVGGLVALRSGDAEHTAAGTAIGTLSGAALGLAVGLFEAPRLLERRRRSQSTHRAQPRREKPSRPVLILGSLKDARGELLWMPQVLSRF